MRQRITVALLAGLIVGWAITPGVAGTITVDGAELVGVQTVNRDNRLLVPLRSIFEALGAAVKYDPDTKQITATKGTISVKLTVNSPVVEVDGNPLLIDVPPLIVEGRVYVPVRFIGTSLGAHVKYFAETETVVISTEAPPPTVTKPAIVAGDLSPETGNPTQMTEDEFAKAIEVIVLVNEERRKKGVPLLEYRNVDLFNAAYARAKELPGSFSHTRPDGSKFATIFPQITYKIAGENLAKNFHSAASAIEGWLGSTGHREAILDRRFSSTAVGVYSYGGTYYWVEFFIGN
jgi:uncharacterized protein YkwD